MAATSKDDQTTMTKRGSMNRLRGGMPLVGALLAVSMLGGCHVFKGHGEKKPKTAVLGERIPVLTAENGASNDTSISAMVVAVPPAETNASWPQPGGNAQKAMGTLAFGAQPERIWSIEAAKANKNERLAAAPVIADGRIFLIGPQGIVRAFDASTGKLIWDTPIKHENGPKIARHGVVGKIRGGERKNFSHSLFGGGVSYDDGKLFATTGLGDVIRLDAGTGKVEWRVAPGGPLRGAPTVANGVIYVVSGDNQIYALNQKDGATQWTASGPLETAGVFGVASPAVAHSTVIAGFSSGDLDAYRYENGRVVWQDALTRTSMSTTVGDVTDIDASPVIDDTRVYAVGAGGRMVALDLVTGQRLWELNVGGISTPALGGDWLVVVGDDARLYCVQRTTGKVRWSSQLPHFKHPDKKNGLIFWSGPVLAGGRLALVNSLGQLVYVSVENGKTIATVKASKVPFTLAPVVANKTMYLLDGTGRLSAWR
jgi:outer membrane protein assembly factor BamB